jgi:hypothetical protein
VVTVPVGATTGNVVVTVAGAASNGSPFTVVLPPSITSLGQTSGAVGASITITGTNFGATQGTSTVTFNGTSAGTASAWSATSITVTVPVGATTGNVVVTVLGTASNGLPFSVAPTITSLSQNAGAVAVSIVINGTNFGVTQGTSTVTFNGTSAGTAIIWTTTLIRVTVPVGATTGNVVVTVLSAASNGVPFTVVLPPSITSLSQTSGAIGASITITGTNFGATQGTSTVTFNGTAAATVTSWSATSIVVTVPVGATTGNVVVTVLGTASNGSPFTVTSPAANCDAAPTGNESMLNGQYAVLVQGYQLAIAASLHADGAGNVGGGEFDVNEGSGVAHATIDASSYTVGLDPTGSGNLGCVLLSLSNGTTTAFRFSLGGLSSGVFTKGRIIEFDDTTGTGSRASGVLRLQDTTSFALSQLRPNYAFGMDGENGIYGSHFASAGSFTVNASGNISSAFADTNLGEGAGGSETTGGTGTINAISTTTGRATMSLTWGGQTTNQAIYMVNADEFFIIGTDPLSSVPIYSGRAIVTASSFTQSSLSGNYGIRTTDVSPSCSYLSGDFTYTFTPCASVALSLVTLDSTSGTYSGMYYWYDNSPGIDIPAQISGTYAVDATSGRVTLSVSSQCCVGYIATPKANTEPISAFFVGPTIFDSAPFGLAEFQPSQTYSTSALAGNWFYGTDDPATNSPNYEAGVMNIASSGTITGTLYQSGPSGLATESVGGTVSIGSNGIGSASGGTIVVVTNGTTLVLMPYGASSPNGFPVFPAPVFTVIDLQ